MHSENVTRKRILLNFPTANGMVYRSLDYGQLIEISQLLTGEAQMCFDGEVCGFSHFSINICLRGGKGGFGSLLRSQKNIGKKTDNFDSTRDLDGRRIRVAKKEERLEQWKEKKNDEEKLIASLKGDKMAPAPVTLDKKYVDTLNSMRLSKESAVLEGMSLSFPAVVPVRPKKPMKLIDYE